MSPTDPPQREPAADPSAEEATLRLAAEEVTVTKEVRETGRVRVGTVTRERQVYVDENLMRERVEIETIPVGRQIEGMPEVRQEGDRTIVPVVEEVLVIERRLVLKEEIHIRRVRAVERHQEQVTVRRQEAVITREPQDAGTPGSRADDDTGNASTKSR
jgi:uncharacterized protein (TIGR02271 family)